MKQLTGWRALIALVAVVAVAAAVLTVSHLTGDDRTAGVEPKAAAPRAVPADVSRAIDSFDNTTPTSAANDAYGRYADDLIASAARAPDRAAFWRGVNEAELFAFRGQSTIDALANTMKLLDRTFIEARTSTSSRKTAAAVNGRHVELASDNRPVLKVYYINGILNTHEAAQTDTAQLVDTLGVDIVNYYNASAIDTAPEQKQWCEDAVMSFLETQRQDVLVAALNRDNADAEAIERAAGEGRLKWLWEAMTRSINGALADDQDRLVTGSISAYEYILAKACSTIDGIDHAFRSEIDFAQFLSDLTQNSMDVLSDRLSVALDEKEYDHALVDMIEHDIEGGRRVVVIGHSHGTLIAKLALDEVNRWWAEERLPEVCPPNSVEQVAAPIAALYIAPAFGVSADDQQAGVMLHGDLVQRSHLGGTPTAEPDGPQRGLSARQLHALPTYLEQGTASVSQIRDKFERLRDHVLNVPSAQAACDGRTDPTTSSTEPTDPNIAQALSGKFVEDKEARFPRHYLANSIALSIGKDGTVTGSYNVAFTIDWKYSYEVPAKCVKTYRASGELYLEPHATDGTIENISEDLSVKGCPDFTGDWGRSRGHWRLNHLIDGEADGGVDIQQQGIGFVVRG